MGILFLSATEMEGTCMDRWNIEWDKEEEFIFTLSSGILL